MQMDIHSNSSREDIPLHTKKKGFNMKKSLLTLTVALLASTAAFAADVTHPFYQPEKGGLSSETNLMYHNFDHGKKYDNTVTQGALVTETLTYGVTRKFAVTGTVADVWDFQGRMKKYDTWANPAWSLGVKYNLIDCEKTNLKVQLGANYMQGALSLNPLLNSGMFFKHKQKEFSAFAKIGYQATESFIPYVEGSIIKQVGKYEQDPIWTGRAGGYLTLTDLVSVDAGLDYIWDSATHVRDGQGDIGGNGHIKVFGMDGSVNYKLTEAVSLGLTGSYVFDMKPAEKDYYTVGLNLKAAF